MAGERRASRTHLEVRCEASGQLLGWLTGIEAAKVPHAPLVFHDPGSEMVFEDEDGAEVLGMNVTLDTWAYEQSLDRPLKSVKLVEIASDIPSYAQREIVSGGRQTVYRWVAAVCPRDFYPTLFDFDNFEPHGALDQALAAEERAFHGITHGAAPALSMTSAFKPLMASDISANLIDGSKLFHTGGLVPKPAKSAPPLTGEELDAQLAMLTGPRVTVNVSKAVNGAGVSEAMREAMRKAVGDFSKAMSEAGKALSRR